MSKPSFTPNCISSLSFSVIEGIFSLTLGKFTPFLEEIKPPTKTFAFTPSFVFSVTSSLIVPSAI